MKVFGAVVLCLAVAAAQAIDYKNLIELPIRRNSDGPTNRITGGVEVPPHSLPHQVGIFITLDEGIAFCGGSLISADWVLTAAHCASDGSNFEVVLGAHEIQNENETTQIRVVTSNKTVHPDWDPTLIINDVALLRLPETVTLTPAIQPIRLPSRSEVENTFNGTLALESGWGKEFDGATTIAQYLQAVNKTVIDEAVCARYYFGSIVESAHICTSGSNGQSTCNGDSGGALIIEEDDGKNTQIGIVSFGIALGCEIGWPAVFTRLTSYIDFVSETTGIELRP